MLADIFYLSQEESLGKFDRLLSLISQFAQEVRKKVINYPGLHGSPDLT